MSRASTRIEPTRSCLEAFVRIPRLQGSRVRLKGTAQHSKPLAHRQTATQRNSETAPMRLLALRHQVLDQRGI